MGGGEKRGSVEGISATKLDSFSIFQRERAGGGWVGAGFVLLLFFCVNVHFQADISAVFNNLQCSVKLLCGRRTTPRSCTAGHFNKLF